MALTVYPALMLAPNVTLRRAVRGKVDLLALSEDRQAVYTPAIAWEQREIEGVSRTSYEGHLWFNADGFQVDDLIYLGGTYDGAWAVVGVVAGAAGMLGRSLADIQISRR